MAVFQWPRAEKEVSVARPCVVAGGSALALVDRDGDANLASITSLASLLTGAA